MTAYPLRVPLPDPSTDTQAVPFRVAAERLRISRHALRQRIRRGTIHALNRGGRWYVVVDEVYAEEFGGDTRTSTHTSPRRDTQTGPAEQSAEEYGGGTADPSGDLRQLVTTLQEENARLWRELDTRAEELRRKDTIILQLAGRPVLTAATTTTPEPVPGPVDHAPPSAPTPHRAPWWLRLFQRG